MKKHLLILLLSLPVSLIAQTNIYHPFPDSSANWNFSASGFCYGPSGAIITYQYFSYQFGQDTMINSTVYHTLNIPAFINDVGPGCWGTPIGVYVLPGQYAGAIRNDHPAKKTYIVPEGDTTEQLLFDFNIQVGDTLQGYLAREQAGVPGGLRDTVVSMDSVLVGSTWRKRWLLSDSYHAYLIEGIGSTYSLVGAIPAPFTVDAPNYFLDCFSQDNLPLYPSGVTGCPVLTDIEEIAEKETELIVYPNPAAKELFLQLPSDFSHRLVEVSVVGVDGKKYSQQSLMANRDATVEVELPALKNGMYIIRAGTTDKQLHTRFQVIE